MRSRSSSAWKPAARIARFSLASYPSSSVLSASIGSRSNSSSSNPPERERAVYARPASSASRTSSSSRPLACASSGIVGDRPSVLVELLEVPRQQLVELLQSAGDADGPGAIAEVSFQLSDDCRKDVRHHSHVAFEVELVDCLDEPHRGHLHEVLELLALAGVAAGQRTRKRQQLRDKLVARREVALFAIRPQKGSALGVARHGHGVARTHRAGRSTRSTIDRSGTVRSTTPSTRRSSTVRSSPASRRRRWSTSGDDGPTTT